MNYINYWAQLINESNIHLNPPIYGDGIFVIVEGNLKMGAFAPRVKESVINGFVHIPTILDDDSRAEIVDNISYATVFKEDDLPKMMKWCKNNWKGKTFSIVELEAEFTPVSGEPGSSYDSIQSRQYRDALNGIYDPSNDN